MGFLQKIKILSNFCWIKSQKRSSTNKIFLSVHLLQCKTQWKLHIANTLVLHCWWYFSTVNAVNGFATNH